MHVLERHDVKRRFSASSDLPSLLFWTTTDMAPKKGAADNKKGGKGKAAASDDSGDKGKVGIPYQ